MKSRREENILLWFATAVFALSCEIVLTLRFPTQIVTSGGIRWIREGNRWFIFFFLHNLTSVWTKMWEENASDNVSYIYAVEQLSEYYNKLTRVPQPPRSRSTVVVSCSYKWICRTICNCLISPTIRRLKMSKVELTLAWVQLAWVRLYYVSRTWLARRNFFLFFSKGYFTFKLFYLDSGEPTRQSRRHVK